MELALLVNRKQQMSLFRGKKRSTSLQNLIRNIGQSLANTMP